MQSTIAFILDGRLVRLDLSTSSLLTPTTTVLNYLRSLQEHKGAKEGCAQGDCGACTVVLGELGEGSGSVRYRAVDSCLVFLPMIHGKWLITVENLADPEGGSLHPVQEAMVNSYGSQCGYCTPGVVMSLFALYKNTDRPSRSLVEDAISGNLCRCTGYRAILEAAERACVHGRRDHFTDEEPRIAGLMRSIPRDSIRIQTPKQSYRRPATLSEALEIKSASPSSVVVSGATDVALRVTKNFEILGEILDLSGIEDLKCITRSASSLRIGAAVPLSDLKSALGQEFPALRQMLEVFGSLQIRNLGTLGGSLGTASPIGDPIPVLMAYGASVELASVRGRREIPMDSFITGYRSTLRSPDELITSVILPLPGECTAVKFFKISRRSDMDISSVSAGFRLERDRRGRISLVTLAYGGMAETAGRAKSAERYLTGKVWNRKNAEEASLLVKEDFKPISDARGGANFRRLAARNLLLKFFSETAQ